MDTHRPDVATGRAGGRGAGGRRRRGPALDREALVDVAVARLARRSTPSGQLRTLLEREVEVAESETGRDLAALRDEIPDVIASLVERGYVDDQRFAERAAEDMRRRGHPWRAIRARLRQNDLPDDVIDALAARPDHARLAEEEDLDAAWQTARRRRLGPFRGDAAERAERRDRDLAALARRGFSREVAHRVIDAESADESTP